MRISSEQLAAHLKRTLAPLYIVFGEEPLLALEAADHIRACAHAQGYAERELITVEAHFDWSQLRMSGQSQSLFASRRLLDLRIPGGKPGVDGGEALAAHAARLPEETVTLIQLPAIEWRAQKAPWFQALEAAGVAVEARTVGREALPAWISARLNAQEQQADEDTLNFIADRVEGNLLAAFQEVQKLALIFPPGNLAFEQVREAVLDVARFDVDELGPALVAGDAAHLARVLEALRGEGAAPNYVLWTVSEEIRALGRVMACRAGGRPFQEAWREARVWGAARQRVIERNIARFTAAQIEEALLHAARVDRMIKGLAKGDEWDELLQLGLRFARRPARSKAG
jgi:DNA polymerase III subunit delta